MINFILKKFYAIVDYFIGHQVESPLGYGHHTVRKAGLDPNSLFMVDLIKQCGDNLKVLEIATGKGILAEQITALENVSEYLACDIDPGCIQTINKKKRKIPHFNKLKTMNIDVLNDSFPEEAEFDIVLSDKFLHLLSPQELESFFNIAFRLLKPDGILLSNSVSINNYAYNKTIETSSDYPYYRKLVDNTKVRLWYNINKPFILFMNENLLENLCHKTGFIYNPKLIHNNTKDYFTFATVKDS